MEIREGDVFRWQYKKEPARDYRRKSYIAIARNGWLIDTYWGHGCQDSTGWKFEDAAEKLDLTLLGNLADYDERSDDSAFYRPEDVMDIRHSNMSSGGVYYRKGAQYNREAMLAECKDRIAQAEDKVRFETDRLERLRASRARLEAGETLQWLG